MQRGSVSGCTDAFSVKEKCLFPICLRLFNHILKIGLIQDHITLASDTLICPPRSFSNRDYWSVTFDPFSPDVIHHNTSSPRVNCLCMSQQRSWGVEWFVVLTKRLVLLVVPVDLAVYFESVFIFSLVQSATCYAPGLKRSGNQAGILTN